MTALNNVKYLYDSVTCSICLDILFEPVTLFCQHSFCKDCITQIINNQCPLCRAYITIPLEKNIILDDFCAKLFSKQYVARRRAKNKRIKKIDKIKRNKFNEID